MTTIAGELRSCAADRRLYQELKGFSCGDGNERAEQEVNNIIAACCAGKRPSAELRVTKEHPSGAIVGVVVIERGLLDLQHPDFPPERYRDAAYISAIGLSQSYRSGHRRADGARLGDILLLDALSRISETWGGSMPFVHTVVGPSNLASRSLFERHGFEYAFTLAEDERAHRTGEGDVEGGDAADALFQRPQGLSPS